MSGDSSGYIAALDVGTTLVRCQIIDCQAICRGSSFTKVKPHYPEPGLVEIDPEELWTAIIEVIKDAIEKATVSVKDVRSLAISTQRATFVTWRKDDGRPLHNFITWKDLRAAKLIKEINDSWKMKILRYGSAIAHFFTRQTKFAIVSRFKFTSTHVTVRLLWLLQNNRDVQEALLAKNLMFGTIDTWLVYRLTNRANYVTDISNASATGLYDPFSLRWSFIPKIFDIPLDILPQVVANNHRFGETSEDLFGAAINIGAVMADQSAAMYGSCSFKVNDIKVTLGTGAFLNVNTGQAIEKMPLGVYPLVAWNDGGEKGLVYMMEAACSDAGSLVQWLLSMELISRAEDLTGVAEQVDDSQGVYFIPSFSGLGPPINNETAASGFIGVKENTSKAHMIRAVLESIAFRTALAYQLLNKDKDRRSECLRMNGGVSRNDFVCQLLADLTGHTIRRMTSEMSTLGVAYLAGQSCGFWSTKEDILAINQSEDTFTPTTDPKRLNQLVSNLATWQRAAQRFTSWYQ